MISPETRTLLNEVIESCLTRAKVAREQILDPQYASEREIYIRKAQINLKVADEILEMVQRDNNIQEIV